MARQSPVYYIAPSSLTIIPNANELASDIAVFLAAGTTIRAYSPRAGLDMVDKDFRSWPIAGRNRRLADAEKPYTIYARLPKAEGSKAYVTFAPKVWSEAEQRWLDKYAYITTDGLATGTAPDVTDENNWYAKLGDVSLPEGEAGEEQRTVTLDTGILGTAEFNAEWNVSPDALPLRISLQCMINGETAEDKDPTGSTPYLYWGQVATLTALLTEGWTGTNIQQFDHWEIVRNTNNEDADTTWNAEQNIDSKDFWRTGVINLQHRRGANQTDDFDGTVSAIFTVNAMQLNPEWKEGSSEPQYLVLKSASINIMAETVEKYEVVATTAVMAYNPMARTYTPDGGIPLRVRATTQKGETSQISFNQFNSAGLTCQYAADGVSTWTTFTTPAGSRTWFATVPVGAFSNGKSVNVRITRDGTELHRTTIAYVRDGEDSKEREWIFLRSAEPITFGTQDHPYPANIAQGQVNPTGEASGTDIDKDQDGWVPNGWWDEPQGVDATNRYEYGAYRDFVHESNGVTAHWGAFTEPRIWNHWGKDGEAGDDGLYYVDDYRRYDSRSANATTGAPAGNTDMQGWAETAPAPTETYKYIWKRSRQYNPNTQQFVGNPIYVCLTGERGVDAQDIEWAFIRTKTDTAPVILSDSTYVDSNSHDYTDDDHLPHVSGNSNVENNEGTYECTDDPKGVDDTWKFEWEIKREKADADSDGKRAWNYYHGSMTLHANYAESAYIIDLSNDNDQFGTDSNSFVQAQQTRSTTVSVYDGATKQTLSGLNVELVYEDGTPVSGHDVANYSANAATGVVSVILERNTAAAFSHTEVRALITASVTDKADKQTVFTVRKVMSGQPGLSPTVYQLNPTSKDFVFNRGADGQTLTPAARSTTVNALKTFENVTSDATLADNLTFTWGFDESATAQGSGTVGDSSSNVISVSSILAAAHHQVWILLSTGDRETLPILKDGQKGDSGEDAQYIYLKGTARDEDTTVITTVQNETSVTGGSNAAPHSRGLNLVTINRQTMAVVESLNYDTYLEGRGDAGATGITDLVAKLNTLDDTVFVCLTSFDAIGWNDALISALQSYGMGDLPYTQIGRYPFLFIGYKNLGKGNGLMRMRNVGHYYDVVELSAYVAGGALTVKDGKDGEDGADGGNTATVMLYKRSAATVTSVGISATLYYKFATKKLYTDAACTTEATTQLNGWSLGIPSGADPIYATSAVAYSTEDHDSIGSTEWVTPVQFTGNGENGISTAVVILYKRSATTISAHGITATLYYKFADGKLYTKSGSIYTEATDADLNNWKRDIPASDGNPCYAIQAAALSTEDYDPIATTDWSSVRKIVEDGIDGQDVRENLIDNSEPKKRVNVSDVTPSATESLRRFDTGKSFDVTKVPDDTALSGQMCITFAGCSFGTNAKAWLYFNSSDRWPRIAVIDNPTNGTHEVRKENFIIDSGHGVFNGNVMLCLQNFNDGGTVTVERVKLEVGAKCSPWCLSENDKKGAKGDPGADAWSFVANPANVIVTQSMDAGASNQFTTAAVSFAAKKGNTAATIGTGGVVLAESSTFECDLSGNVVTVVRPKKDTQGNYYTSGSFTVTITATAGVVTATQTLVVLCYANLLGSWKTQVEGDVEQSIATKKFYFKDENGSIVAHETIGDYIKSSTENISTLITSAAGGSNLLLGSEKYTADNKLDHKSAADDGAIEYNGQNNRPHIYTPIQLEKGVTYTLQVKSDGTLASGHQVVAENQGKFTVWLRINGTKDGAPYNGICFSAENLTGTRSDGALYWTFTCALSGEYWFRTNTYSPNLTEVECHSWDIMLQQGAIASDWVAPARGTMSQIKQTADEIEAKVNETGVDITNGKVDLYADKVRFFKNKAAATAGDTAKIWIDGGDGTLHAVDVHLSGFLRKAKTVITTSNIEQYKRDDITSATVLDFDKCGSFIELSTGTAGYLTLPLMSNYLVQHYTQEQIDWIRTFVGAKILIYNQSGQILTLGLKTDSNGNTTSETLGNGRCMELECCLARDTVDNKEIICWEVISDAVALVKT